MVGLSSVALGAAPVFGGALLAVVGGQLMHGWDFRSGIKDDIELLELFPDDEVARREALRRSIADGSTTSSTPTPGAGSSALPHSHTTATGATS